MWTVLRSIRRTAATSATLRNWGSRFRPVVSDITHSAPARHTRNSIRRRPILFAFALDVVSGCSFVFVKSPSTTPQRAQLPDCTPSYAAPVVDTLLVGTAGLAVAWGAAQGGPALRGPYDFANLAPTVALWAGVAAVATSAVYGYIEVRGCRAAWARPTILPLGPGAS